MRGQAERKGIVHEVLTHLSRLPESVEADWLEQLEEEEG